MANPILNNIKLNLDLLLLNHTVNGNSPNEI